MSTSPSTPNASASRRARRLAVALAATLPLAACTFGGVSEGAPPEPTHGAAPPTKPPPAVAPAPQPRTPASSPGAPRARLPDPLPVGGPDSAPGACEAGCPPVNCARAVVCVTACGGPETRCGCCPCAEGSFPADLCPPS